MARLEDLLTEVEDGSLREALADEVKRLKKQVTFGLVFERHLPESVLVNGSVRVGVGDRVRLRREPKTKVTWEVAAIKGKTATLIPTNGAATNGDTKARKAPLADLLVVRDFGDPIYPALVPVGEVRRSEARPYHAVINAENYHGLQALLYAYEGQVDCIYADVPYNTGARDWKYNNDYVDSSDTWRHSKWLSMMEKRLRFAGRLLKPDGVLVCTIDEHEVHHLGVLLEQLFPGVQGQLVTIVINPLGQARNQELGRVEEYAYFLFFGDAQPAPMLDDLLNASTSGTGIKPRWERLLRGGTDSNRAARPTMFYPVFIDPSTKQVLSVGDALSLDASWRDVKAPKGQVAVWPVRTDGSEGRWRLQASTLRSYIEQGVAKVGSYDRTNDHWTILYLGDAMRRRIEEGDILVTGRNPAGAVEVEYANATASVAKTVWNRGSHRAGEYGSRVLHDFTGDRQFPFPKSLYAVTDTLRVATGERKGALIVDFVAGSGTTLHATALLNSEDDGTRRCILVTNNEVDEAQTAKLHEAGAFPGDPEFERHGIFDSVTRPRCTAAITGVRPDGKPVAGKYLDDKPYAEGFEENIEFFTLEYLDPDYVELGRCFEQLHPLLWMMAGGRGKRPKVKPGTPFVVAEECGYAVMFEETSLRELVVALNDAPGVEHVFFVTDSSDAFAEMCNELAAGHKPHMLYGEYLSAFRSFVGRSP